MSFLDMDEKLIELAQIIDVVYSPTVDIKQFPQGVDVALVEGAVSSEEDLHKIRTIRARTRILVALGDCAVTGNVPAMRNPFAVEDLFARAYQENATYPADRKTPQTDVPPLRPRCCPIHEVVKVDLFVPGCPPPAAAIVFVVTELLAGRTPDPSGLTRFGK
jgi:NAD-reducing hydrogenase small subunit